MYRALGACLFPEMLGRRLPLSGPRHHSSQQLRTMPAISCVGALIFMSRIFRRPFPSRLVFRGSGSPGFARAPKGPEDFARTPGKIPTLFPMEAYILLAVAFGNHSPLPPLSANAPPVPAAGGISASSVDPRGIYNNGFLLKSVKSWLPVVEKVLLYLLQSTAPRCRPSCMIRGTYPCPYIAFQV